MANEINVDYDSGQFLYAQIWNAVGQVWSNVANAFVSYATVDVANYAIALTEQGTASGIYLGTFPSAIPAGIYKIVARKRASAVETPVETHPRCGAGIENWDGSALVPVTSKTHIADAYLDRANAIAGSVTPREHMRRTGAVLAGRLSGAGGGTETFKDYAGNDAVVVTTPDDAGNRTAVSFP